MNKKEDAILRASQRKFLLNGLKKTTMEEISKEASVSKATLYKYFSNKEILIEKFMRHIFESSMEVFLDYVDNKKEKKLKKNDFIKIFDMDQYSSYFQSDFIKELSEHYPHIFHLYIEWTNREMWPILEQFFITAQKDGVLRSDIDPKLMVRYIWVMQRAFQNLYEEDAEVLAKNQLKKYKQTFNDMFLHGVVEQKNYENER